MAAPADSLYRRLLIAALAAVALAYLAQLPTPLRLHNDTVVLVSMGESVAHGGGFRYHGTGGHYAFGYPAIVALMMKLGVFRIWTAIALNFLFLALGLWAASKLLPHGGIISLLTLLSFVTIKHASIPLTDSIFFGIAMLCLTMLVAATPRPVEACVLALIATAIRFNGVALVPPVLWVLYKRRPVLVWPALAAIALVSIRVASLLKPFHRVVAGHTLLDSAVQILEFRGMEFGEIAINLPASVFPPVGNAILPWFGALVMTVIAGGIWVERKSFGPTEIFFVGFAAILFVWPYYDPRFWLPVLPLIFGYAARAIRSAPAQPLVVYVTAFCLIGIAVLAISVRITYAGTNFPDAYGNTQFRPTYCAYYGTCAADPKEIDADALHLLRTYR